MKGYIILYNTTSRKDITKINHELFGRIITVPKKSKTFRYYYPGSFEKVGHIKLANGCYFVRSIGSNCDGLVKYIRSEIDVSESVCITGRQKWEEYVIRKEFKVKHLNY